ncbi:MAG TPA: 5-oxoprolinase subunit PxpA [Gammaproteobacteria bacterium]|nr:5-oxoprolinase subunit PxpA [Gammaproteobacteria bacterium]
MLIDLNADVGEECGDDAALIPLLTSANVSCGVHAGDIEVMRRTVAICRQHEVTVGAHVSYPDREHFGRRDMTLPAPELTRVVLEQLRTLSDITAAAGTPMRYLKAHGALYNRMADDAAVADAVLAAIQVFDPKLLLLTLPASVAMARARTVGIGAVGEAFADRGYRDDGRLQPRDQEGALVTDAGGVATRALRLAREGIVESVGGKPVTIKARSLCVHGDTPGAVMLAGAVRGALQQAGVELRAFA